MTSKNYGLDGVAANLELGQGGIRCRDAASVFEFRDAADTAYVSIAGLNAVMVGGIALAGAALADGVATGNDVVAGDGTADQGITVFPGAANSGWLYMTDTSATHNNGALEYDMAAAMWLFHVAGAAELNLTATRLGPNADAGLDLGIDGTRFGTLFADNVTAGGGVVADGVATGDDAVLGDGVGDRGLTVFAAAASSAFLYMTDTAATNNNGALEYDMAAAVFFFHVVGNQEMTLSATLLGPVADAGLDLGIDGTRWATVFSDNLTAKGGVVADGPASADGAVIGDGAAEDYGITIFTGPANSGRVVYTDVAGTIRGSSRYDHSTPGLFWGIEGADEMLLNANRLQPVVDGGLHLGIDGTRWATVFADNLTAGGAVVADGVNGDDLVLGDGVGDRGLTIFAAAASSAWFVMTDTTGTNNNFAMQYDMALARMQMYIAGVHELNISATLVGPQVDGGLDLGIDGTRFGTVFADNLTAGGAVVADGAAGLNDLVLGDGVGSRGLTIFAGAAAEGAISFNDAAGVVDGHIRYRHGSQDFIWKVANTDELILTASVLAPVADGGLTLGVDITNQWLNIHSDAADIDGDTRIGGDLNHDGLLVGFYGTAPAAQSAAYTLTATAVPGRTLAANASATAGNNNSVLAALIADLQLTGIIA